MKCIDILIGVDSSTVHLVDALSQEFIRTVNTNTKNDLCVINTVAKDIEGFSDYYAIMVENYTGRQLLGFFDYGPGKTVLDIPTETSSGKAPDTVVYEEMPVFAGFTYMNLTLSPGYKIFMDPAYPSVRLRAGEVKSLPITPAVQAAIGTILQED